MLGTYRSLWRKKVRVISFVLFLLNVLLFGLIYRFAFTSEDFTWANDESSDKNWTDYMYFSVSTASTTGFGDIVPKTKLCRLVVSIQQICSVFIISILLIH